MVGVCIWIDRTSEKLHEMTANEVERLVHVNGGQNRMFYIIISDVR